MAEQRITVNPGIVDWSGENPGIYLRDEAEGPWVTLGVFFRVVLSPFGIGHAMLVLDEPNTSKKSVGAVPIPTRPYPESPIIDRFPKSSRDMPNPQ